MPTIRNVVSPTPRLIFPIAVTIVTGLIAPKALPLIGSIMLGNFMRECGAVARLTKASENEIANIVTLFLGLAIGATMQADKFLKATDAGDLRARLRRVLSTPWSASVRQDACACCRAARSTR